MVTNWNKLIKKAGEIKMKLKQKLLGFGLAALLSGCSEKNNDLNKPQKEEAQRVDAIVRICETSLNSQIYRDPQTVITVDGVPTYNVTNISRDGSEGLCWSYSGFPGIINADTGQRTLQDCYWTADNENLEWAQSAIRPRDILIKSNNVYTPISVRNSGRFSPCKNYSIPE